MHYPSVATNYRNKNVLFAQVQWGVVFRSFQVINRHPCSLMLTLTGVR